MMLLCKNTLKSSRSLQELVGSLALLVSLSEAGSQFKVDSGLLRKAILPDMILLLLLQCLIIINESLYMILRLLMTYCCVDLETA
ncbi:uncharacterized protein V6R79_025626 [Siganus canaliculatus]